ncbi:MAG: transglycosylase SLT domain-containing protein [Alicyclobacillus sp.]|nr:transglycosylase SLT domain-containing protein [Alicyclobacillus sp.]
MDHVRASTARQQTPMEHRTLPSGPVGTNPSRSKGQTFAAVLADAQQTRTDRAPRRSSGAALPQAPAPAVVPQTSLPPAFATSPAMGTQMDVPDALLQALMTWFVQTFLASFGPSGASGGSAAPLSGSVALPVSDVNSDGADAVGTATDGNAGGWTTGALSTATSTGVLNRAQLQAVTAQAAQLAGVPASWVTPLVAIAEHESAGHVAAVNPEETGDGEHAVGLMQTEPTTFAAYALPGHADIENPVDNMVAAIRYIEARYGDPNVALARSLRGGY